MTPEDVAAAFGVEVLVAEEVFLDDECTHAGCDVEDPLILHQGATLCLRHAVDDGLGPLLSNPEGIRRCKQCGKSTARCLSDHTPIHDRCRVNYVTKRVKTGHLKGAYARRRKLPGNNRIQE